MLVSVIIPTYNRLRLLEQAINSVLVSTYSDFEIIVVNDGGQDISWLPILNHDKVKYYYKDNGGLSSARNYGLLKCMGKYVQFLDDDDIIYHEKLERHVNLHEELDCKISYCYADCGNDDVKQAWKYNKTWVNWSDLRKGNFVPVHAWFINKEVFDDVGLFDETLVSFEDWDFMLRATRKYGSKCIEDILCFYRTENFPKFRKGVILNSWDAVHSHQRKDFLTVHRRYR